MWWFSSWWNLYFYCFLPANWANINLKLKSVKHWVFFILNTGLASLQISLLDRFVIYWISPSVNNCQRTFQESLHLSRKGLQETSFLSSPFLITLLESCGTLTVHASQHSYYVYFSAHLGSHGEHSYTVKRATG